MKRFLLLLFFCLFGLSVNAMDFPKLTGQVVDEAGIINARTKDKILSMLREGQQFVVVTLKDLRGYEIEEYGLELARHWGIGHKDHDDGVLLIVAPNERQVRIEVGYGLEGDLTDAKSSEIIRHILLPAFKTGNYDDGIVRAVDVINRIIAGEQVDVETGELSFFEVIFMIFFFLFVLFANLTPSHSDGSGGGGGSHRSSFRGGGGSFGGGGASGRW